MRFPAQALALLGALALLLASTGTHAHASGSSLDKPCAVCAARVQSASLCPAPAAQLPALARLAIELFHPAPAARDFRLRGGTPPRGPPLTA
jgi:hypothetical protein